MVSYFDSIERKRTMVLLSSFVVLVLLALFVQMQSNSITGSAIMDSSKETCPYQCCTTDSFVRKECAKGFSCNNNFCVAADTDLDGLSDKDEINKSNPLFMDSDGDGLGDVEEIRLLKTDPMNRNTDYDRYLDGYDPDPILKNSAKIQVDITEVKFFVNWANIGSAFLGDIKNQELDIAESEIVVTTKNTGTDHSNYLLYDLVFYLDDVEIKRFHVQKSTIGSKQESSETLRFLIKTKDIPEELYESIIKKSASWDARLDNLSYEKY